MLRGGAGHWRASRSWLLVSYLCVSVHVHNHCERETLTSEAGIDSRWQFSNAPDLSSPRTSCEPSQSVSRCYVRAPPRRCHRSAILGEFVAKRCVSTMIVRWWEMESGLTEQRNVRSETEALIDVRLPILTFLGQLHLIRRNKSSVAKAALSPSASAACRFLVSIIMDRCSAPTPPAHTT